MPQQDIITIITPEQARERFGSRVMTPAGLVWRGNLRMAALEGYAWPI